VIDRSLTRFFDRVLPRAAHFQSSKRCKLSAEKRLSSFKCQIHLVCLRMIQNVNFGAGSELKKVTLRQPMPSNQVRAHSSRALPPRILIPRSFSFLIFLSGLGRRRCEQPLPFFLFASINSLIMVLQSCHFSRLDDSTNASHSHLNSSSCLQTFQLSKMSDSAVGAPNIFRLALIQRSRHHILLAF
jgi:hypothetical protein